MTHENERSVVGDVFERVGAKQPGQRYEPPSVNQTIARLKAEDARLAEAMEGELQQVIAEFTIQPDQSSESHSANDQGEVQLL